MKLFLTISFLIFTNFIFGQALPDSIYLFYAEGSNDYNESYDRHTYSRNPDSTVLNIDFINKANNTIGKGGKTVYYYPECSTSGFSKLRDYSYNSFDDTYSLSFEATNNFNNQCQVVEALHWIGAFQDTFFLGKFEDFDIYGYSKKAIYYDRDFNNGNLYLSQIITSDISYNTNNFATEIISITNYTNGNKSTNKRTFEYDSQDRNINNSVFLFDTILNDFIETYRLETNYGDNLTVLKTYFRNEIELKINSIDSLFYDEKNNNNLRIVTYLNDDETVDNKYKYIYFYPQSSSTNNPISNHKLVINNIFSNNSTLSFEIDNQQKENLSIQVIDYLGKLYYTNNVNSADWSSPNINLPQGVFFINVKSKNWMETKKVFVH